MVKDLVGRTVWLKETLKTHGGEVFAAGTPMHVIGVQRRGRSKPLLMRDAEGRSLSCFRRRVALTAPRSG